MKTYAKDGTRLRHKEYLNWIRSLRCWLNQLHGLGEPAHGKPWGRGMKGPDFEALPQCRMCHNAEHGGILKIDKSIRQQAIDAYNALYCATHGITIDELRHKQGG